MSLFTTDINFRHYFGVAIVDLLHILVVRIKFHFQKAVSFQNHQKVGLLYEGFKKFLVARTECSSHFIEMK